MTAVETTGGFTRADLDAMPDDGRRYELLNGTIIVSAAPSPPHQRVAFRLGRLLDDCLPADVEMFLAPLDVVLPTGDVLEPDVLIARRSTITDKDVTGVPLLAVEVLSPSSRRRDVGEKQEAYRDAGVPSYWVVDPIQPRLRAWRLEDAGTEVRAQRASKGEYVEIADVSGDEEWTATEPFEVTVRPSALTG